MSNNVLENWQAANNILFQDVIRAAGEVESVQASRYIRSYIQTVFAQIEGDISGMERVTLQARTLGIFRREKHFVRFVFRMNLFFGRFIKVIGIYGVTRYKRRKRFEDNLKFTFDSFSEAHGFSCPVDFNTSGWKALLKSLKIRNRLLHPKHSHDLEVIQKDLDIVQVAADWYFMNRRLLFEKATNQFKSHLMSPKPQQSRNAG
jgi:hypothetical protein